MMFSALSAVVLKLVPNAALRNHVKRSMALKRQREMAFLSQVVLEVPRSPGRGEELQLELFLCSLADPRKLSVRRFETSEQVRAPTNQGIPTVAVPKKSKALGRLTVKLKAGELGTRHQASVRQRDVSRAAVTASTRLQAASTTFQASRRARFQEDARLTRRQSLHDFKRIYCHSSVTQNHA